MYTCNNYFWDEIPLNPWKVKSSCVPWCPNFGQLWPKSKNSGEMNVHITTLKKKLRVFRLHGKKEVVFELLNLETAKWSQFWVFILFWKPEVITFVFLAAWGVEMVLTIPRFVRYNVIAGFRHHFHCLFFACCFLRAFLFFALLLFPLIHGHLIKQYFLFSQSSTQQEHSRQSFTLGYSTTSWWAA